MLMKDSNGIWLIGNNDYLSWYFSLLKKLFPKLKTEEQIDLKTVIYSLTPFISIFILFFYSLGYLFLYGYHFYGEIENVNLLNIITFYIPFNYKTVVAVGFFIALLFISIIPSTQLLNKGIANKNIITYLVGLSTLVLIISIESIFLIFAFIGSNIFSEDKLKMITNIIFPYYFIIFIVNLTVLVYAKKKTKLFISLFYTFIVYIPIAYLVNKLQILEIVRDDDTIIFLSLWMLSSTILVFVNRVPIIIYITPLSIIITFSLLFCEPYTFILKWINTEFLKSQTYLIIPVLISFIIINIILINILIVLLTKLININLLNKITRNIKNTYKDIVPKYLIIGSSMILMVLYTCIISYWVLSIGAEFQKNLSVDKLYTIRVNMNSDNEIIIKGNIICLYNEAYYISNEKKQLNIVKSEYVFIDREN